MTSENARDIFEARAYRGTWRYRLPVMGVEPEEALQIKHHDCFCGIHLT